MSKDQSRRVSCALLALVVLVGAIVAALFMEWRVDLDVHSGRIRSRLLIGGCVLSESIDDTDFSRMARGSVDPQMPPHWRIVQYTSPLQPRSPYCRFHTVPEALREFVLACRMEWISDEDRDQLLPEIFECLENEELYTLDEILAEAAARGDSTRRQDAMAPAPHVELGTPSGEPDDEAKAPRDSEAASWEIPDRSTGGPPLTAAQMERLEAEIRVDLVDGVAMELVLIPAGEFLMGSPESEWARRSNEGPQHLVKITKPFYLGKYEVTQEEWEAVMGSNPSRRKGPRRPVVGITWQGCREFIEKLNEQSGDSRLEFRLPFEAEWEYACRAGTTTAWSFGDDPHDLEHYAWFIGNSERQTHPVGQKKPNPWGLYDVHGNVSEWCADCYVLRPYSHDYRTAPVPMRGRTTFTGYRTLRNGSRRSSADGTRSACRALTAHDHPSHVNGLRVAASPEP